METSMRRLMNYVGNSATRPQFCVDLRLICCNHFKELRSALYMVKLPSIIHLLSLSMLFLLDLTFAYAVA